MSTIQQEEYVFNLHGVESITVRRHPIPDYIESVIRRNEHETKGDYSVTELLDAPRCARLKRQYPHLENDDALKNVSAMVGSAVHAWFESYFSKVARDSVSTEVEMLFGIPQVDGITISGSCDIYNHVTSTVEDIKNWKSYKWMDGDIWALVWQLRMYGYALMKSKNWSVKQLRAVLFFTDWNKLDAARRGNKYPPASVVILEIPMVSTEEVEAFIEDRIRQHMLVRFCEEPFWPDAPEYATWDSVSSYKVFKNADSSRAVSGGVYGINMKVEEPAMLEAANKHAAEIGGVVRRVSSGRKRCAEYCSVSGQCSTYQKYLVREQVNG